MTYEDLPEGVPASISMLAGSLAGIIEHTCVYPLDVLKTRMQVDGQVAQLEVWGGLRRIVSAEGSARLFRGIGSVVLGAGPAHAIYFGVYEGVKIRFPTQVEWMGWAMAGASATAASDAVMTPFDTLKQRMQLIRKRESVGVFSTARQVVSKEGWRSLWLSYPTTICLTIPFHALHFPLYEGLCKRFNPEGEYQPTVHCVSGAMAGGLAAALTTPIDVVKTCLQTKGTRLSGMQDACKLVWQESGILGFTRGMFPRILAHMPSTAVCWTVYEYFKWVLAQ